jgi:hypothetical protein
MAPRALAARTADPSDAAACGGLMPPRAATYLRAVRHRRRSAMLPAARRSRTRPDATYAATPPDRAIAHATAAPLPSGTAPRRRCLAGYSRIRPSPPTAPPSPLHHAPPRLAMPKTLYSTFVAAPAAPHSPHVVLFLALARIPTPTSHSHLPRTQPSCPRPFPHPCRSQRLTRSYWAGKILFVCLFEHFREFFSPRTPAG